MFNRDNVCVRIAAVNHQQMEKDDAEISLAVLTCEVSPFTPELAGDLHDFVKRTLYTSQDVEVNSLLAGAKFSLEIRPQAVAFRMAPDQKKVSFTLDEAKVSDIKAKRSKKSTAWVLEFKLTCSPASEHQLAQIVESYLKSRYLSFAPAVAGLFDEAPRAAEPGENEPELPAGGDQPALH